VWGLETGAPKPLRYVLQELLGPFRGDIGAERARLRELKKAIPGANVPVGSHGRLIYICQRPTLSYLVEFFDSHQSFGEFSLLAADDYLEKRST